MSNLKSASKEGIKSFVRSIYYTRNKSVVGLRIGDAIKNGITWNFYLTCLDKVSPVYYSKKPAKDTTLEGYTTPFFSFYYNNTSKFRVVAFPEQLEKKEPELFKDEDGKWDDWLIPPASYEPYDFLQPCEDNNHDTSFLAIMLQKMESKGRHLLSFYNQWSIENEENDKLYLKSANDFLDIWKGAPVFLENGTLLGFITDKSGKIITVQKLTENICQVIKKHKVCNQVSLLNTFIEEVEHIETEETGRGLSDFKKQFLKGKELELRHLPNTIRRLFQAWRSDKPEREKRLREKYTMHCILEAFKNYPSIWDCALAYSIEETKDFYEVCPDKDADTNTRVIYLFAFWFLANYNEGIKTPSSLEMLKNKILSICRKIEDVNKKSNFIPKGASLPSNKKLSSADFLVAFVMLVSGHKKFELHGEFIMKEFANQFSNIEKKERILKILEPSFSSKTKDYQSLNEQLSEYYSGVGNYDNILKNARNILQIPLLQKYEGEGNSCKKLENIPKLKFNSHEFQKNVVLFYLRITNFIFEYRSEDNIYNAVLLRQIERELLTT